MSCRRLEDSQQYFLQLMLGKSVIDEISFKKVFRAVLEKFSIHYESDSQIKEMYIPFLKKCNDAIKQFHLEIKKGTCETSGITYFALIRQSDGNGLGSISQLYTPTELQVFRILLREIVDSDEGCVEFVAVQEQVLDDFNEHAAALTQTQSSKIPSSREVRLCVEKFIRDYWLVELIARPGFITLHGRALMELTDYIRDTFEASILNDCAICKSLVLCGVTCHSCNCVYHPHCAKNLFLKQSACAKCKRPFPDEQIAQLRENLAQSKTMYTQQSQAQQISSR